MEVDVFMNFMRLGKVAHGADTWLGSIDWIDVTGFNAKVVSALVVIKCVGSNNSAGKFFTQFTPATHLL